MKKIIIAVIVFVLIIVGVTVLVDYLKYKSVDFTLNDGTYTVEVYNESSSNPVLKVDKSSTQRLIPGEYYYAVIGENLSDETVAFTVGSDDNNVTVTPAFSEDYLSVLAEKEIDAISSLVANTYPLIINRYEIEKPKLYEKGEWAAGYLVQNVDRRQSPDVYRYIMQKVDSRWVFVAKPQLSIYAKDYPEIPVDIIDSINQSR